MVENKLLAALKRRAQLAKEREQSELESKIKENKNAIVPHFEPPKVENLPNLRPQGDGAITLNQNQLQAVALATQNKSFCLIGAAGTGKTTTMKEVARVIKASLGESFGSESLVLCAYTNRAARNLSLAVQELGFDKHTKTIHKWLEFAPVYHEVMDSEGKFKTTMRFEPKRTAENPLAAKIVVIDEASMVEPDLFKQLWEATPDAIYILIGDINQIPPVFGNPILGYALNCLPVVELTEVYRQSWDSPIITFQHTYTLKGKAPTDTDLKKLTEGYSEKGLSFRPFKVVDPDPFVMAEAVAHYMFRNYKEGIYDPTQDTILIPYNKSFGTIHANLHLANLLGQDRGAEVHEVKSGWQNHYLAIGDFIMYDKQECYIIDIKPNQAYFGEPCIAPSTNLNRFGVYRGQGNGTVELLNNSILNLSQKDLEEVIQDEEELSRQGSHIIYLQNIDDGTVIQAKTSGELNRIEFGYAMTVHKSQGSEWRKVWFVLCRQHRTQLSREILYTGMTRAKEQLEVIYTAQTAAGRRDNSIARAINSPRFRGTTWQQKAQRFKTDDAEIINSMLLN